MLNKIYLSFLLNAFLERFLNVRVFYSPLLQTVPPSHTYSRTVRGAASVGVLYTRLFGFINAVDNVN